MAHVKGITKEKPSPTEERPYPIGGLRRKRYLLAAFAADTIHLIGIGVLHHEGKIVMLRLDISSVRLVEIAEIFSKERAYAMEEICFGFFHGQAIALTINRKRITPDGFPIYLT